MYNTTLLPLCQARFALLYRFFSDASPFLSRDTYIKGGGSGLRAAPRRRKPKMPAAFCAIPQIAIQDTTYCGVVLDFSQILRIMEDTDSQLTVIPVLGVLPASAGI
jgi:hypothetical protein